MNGIDNGKHKQELMDIVQQTLDLARSAGATAAEVDIGTGSGLSVTARLGEVETIEHQRDKGLGVTVYLDQRKGSASTTDFSTPALRDCIRAACAIASHTSPDEYAGLLDPQYLAREIPDLDLHHPWRINPDQAIALAVACEDAARSADQRIRNSEGANLNSYSGTHVYGNSNAFINGWDWSNHSLDCAVIAEENGSMQRDGWYTRGRDPDTLEDIVAVGREAGRRAAARLGARKLKTAKVPVIFEAPVAGGLFGAFISAISGGALYRKSSFLLDKLGQAVFADRINIHEQPHLRKGIGSAPFDNDGMATRDRRLVADGVLQGYVLSAYSARKLGMEPTGNAGGVHNLIIEHDGISRQELIRRMDRGLLITDLIGYGINLVTGDYSRGAVGMWIENGEIQHPVEEITIAGRLQDMFRNIIAIADDIDTGGNIRTGSVLIEDMTVAGS